MRLFEAISHFLGIWTLALVIKPKTEEDHHYRVLFRFDTQKNLDVRPNSKERLQLVEKIDR